MGSDEPLLDVAVALSDGAPVDWESAARSVTSEDDRRLLAELRFIADMARPTRADSSGLFTSSTSGARSGPAPAVRETRYSAGESWGPLKIIEHVGRGTFGDVYRAWDSRLDREVALKILRQQEPDDQAGASTVIEEGRLLARVRHPNVVTVYGAERISGEVGVWMEFVHGKTVEQQLRDEGPFDVDRVIRIGVELSGALSTVHRAGLIHRDVKAQNVLCDRDGRLVLTDFGAGCEVQQTTRRRYTRAERHAALRCTGSARWAIGDAVERRVQSRRAPLSPRDRNVSSARANVEGGSRGSRQQRPDVACRGPARPPERVRAHCQSRARSGSRQSIPQPRRAGSRARFADLARDPATDCLAGESVVGRISGDRCSAPAAAHSRHHVGCHLCRSHSRAQSARRVLGTCANRAAPAHSGVGRAGNRQNAAFADVCAHVRWCGWNCAGRTERRGSTRSVPAFRRGSHVVHQRVPGRRAPRRPRRFRQRLGARPPRAGSIAPSARPADRGADEC